MHHRIERAAALGQVLQPNQFLQGLRLRVQHDNRDTTPENPNLIDTRTLSVIDRRILKESFREARKLQQRLAVDYPG